jgi:preprotein translocase subunit SecE
MKNSPVINFVRTSFEELTKVTWPTKNQAIRLTIIVLIMCVVIAVILGALDYGFNVLYQYVLNLNY